MPAKRLRSADIVVFPNRARVPVYTVAQTAAQMPLEDRESYIERELALYLDVMESRYPAEVAWAQSKTWSKPFAAFWQA